MTDQWDDMAQRLAPWMPDQAVAVISAALRSAYQRGRGDMARETRIWKCFHRGYVATTEPDAVRHFGVGECPDGAYQRGRADVEREWANVGNFGRSLSAPPESGT